MKATSRAGTTVEGFTTAELSVDLVDKCIEATLSLTGSTSKTLWHISDIEVVARDSTGCSPG